MRTIEWRDGIILTLDQTKLPTEVVTLKLETSRQVAEAMRAMKIRGAPLLGVAAGFALALTAFHSRTKSKTTLLAALHNSADEIRSTRPTAVNLFWALNRIMKKAETTAGNTSDVAQAVIAEAQKIAEEDVRLNRLMGKHGAELLCDGDTVLTHCNAGALATVDYGTALGVIRTAWEQGKKIEVIATETRPKLQGARLTTYELMRDKIPVTLITDSMVGYVMSRRLINKVIVGADRIVRDAVVNKIGTFAIAVLAKEHCIPFYVAAPKSTFDLSRNSQEVMIEERNPREVTHMGSTRIAADGVRALNPAFDSTPLNYVTAIVCECGVIYKEDFHNL